MSADEKEAEKWFSIYVRLRDTDQYGFGRCIETGKKIFYKRDNSTGKMVGNCDAGHYKTRAISSIKFNEANVNAQLSTNNRSGAIFRNMRENMMRKWGADIVMWLDKAEKKFGDGDFVSPDYAQVAKHYREKSQDLLKNKMF